MTETVVSLDVSEMDLDVPQPLESTASGSGGKRKGNTVTLGAVSSISFMLFGCTCASRAARPRVLCGARRV
jgi:hypothetical protein